MPSSPSRIRDDRESDRERRRHHSSRHRSRSPDDRRHRSSRDDDRRREKRCSADDDEEDRSNGRSRDHDRDGGRKDKKHKRDRETSVERAERKAAKRKAKEAEADELEQAAQRAAAAELSMYSSTDNPFNDANLDQKFKWGKKEQKERKMGMTPAEARRKDEQRRLEAKEELARLNARRAEREKEQALREEEEARMARLAESAQMSEWVAKEDDFHLEQSRRRATIRVRENRAKPIDLLAINLKWADPVPLTGEKDEDADEEEEEAGLEIDLEEPYNIFDSLTLEETEELHQDIQMYLTLEKNESNLDFWRSMIVVCDDRLSELRAAAQPGIAARLDPSVQAETNAMLSGKTYEQLVQLQDQVRAKLRSGEPLDVEYWEGLLKSLVVWRAKAKLRDMHEVVLSNRLEYLRKRQRDQAIKHQSELAMHLSSGADMLLDPFAGAREAEAEAELAAERDAALAAEEKERETMWEPEMSPEPVDPSRLTYEERRLTVIPEEEDREKLLSSRRTVLASTFVPKVRTAPAPSGEEEDPSVSMYKHEASKALDVEEETFNTDEALARQTYMWEDKFRPRKPRYFNRVHTGYEWNKYNQTHYDTDNPPPKVVQGYKFNIFYPDLIDKTSAPTYKIIKEPGNTDTVLLLFTAGPPYEDLAFRIVNREWEYSHRRGFRSSFDRGVLQLYFNFKRMHYRK